MEKRNALILAMFFIIAAIPSSFAATNRQTDLDVVLLDYSPEPVQPGQVIDLFILVDPMTGGTPKDVSLKVVEEYPFTTQKTQDYEYAQNLKEITYAQKLHFRIKIDETAPDGVTPLRIRYTVDGQEGIREKTFDINIQTFDAQIQISQIKQSPEMVEPGKEFEVTLSLYNTDDKSLDNVDVTLDLTNTFDAASILNNMVAVQSLVNARLEQVNRRVASGLSPLNGITPMSTVGQEQKKLIEYNAFSTVQSTNQKNMGRIGGKTATKTTFKMRVLPTTKPGIYAIPLYISYNDEDNNPFYTRVDIPVVVDMAPDVYIELKDTSLRSTDFAGELNFQIANRGVSPIQYITVELEKSDSISLLTAPQSIYVGTLEPGEVANASFMVLAQSEEITIPLVVSYRDTFNEEHIEHKEIQHTIINKYFYRDPPYEIWLTWIILGIVVFFLTLYFVSQMSKKKK